MSSQLSIDNAEQKPSRIKSVFHGNDGEIIDAIMEIHAPTFSMLDRLSLDILDVTHNRGVMWRGTSWTPHRMDINPDLDVDTVGDFMDIPFGDESWDVLVFDPPHLPANAASEHSSLIWEQRYGITATGRGRDGNSLNVSGMFLPFLSEAKRVLRSGGIIIAKIADLTHCGKYQWQGTDFVNTVRLLPELEAVDMALKVRKTKLVSSKWKTQRSFDKVHTYFFVVRKK